MPPGSGAGEAGAGSTGAGGREPAREPADAAVDPGATVRCAACDRVLVVSKVTIGYMGSAFDVDLQRCPSCGQVYIPEAIALGKMADVEQQLEDK
jgi:phage FluMu protein Com